MFKLRHAMAVTALGTAGILGTVPALAAGVTYSYVDGAYIWDSSLDFVGGGEIDDDGFGLSASIDSGKSLFLTLEGDRIKFSDLGDSKLTSYGIGLGLRKDIIEPLSLYGELLYESVRVQVPGDSDSEDGLGFRLGIRGLIAEKIELNGELGYIDIGGNDIIRYGAQGVFYFGPIGVFIAYKRIDYDNGIGAVLLTDAGPVAALAEQREDISAGVRWNFGYEGDD